MSSTVIVIPCYNEAQRFDADAFRRFITTHDNIHFVLVDDGSSDGTFALLEQLHAAFPSRIDVLKLPHNGGKAEAVRSGILQGADQRPDYIGFWDADLAAPLDAIPKFIAALDSRAAVLMAIGVRIPLSGRTIRRRFSRRLLGTAFSRLASHVLGSSLIDTQCGAKLFRATNEILPLFSEPFRARWIFDFELLARLAAARRQAFPAPLAEVVYELPLEMWRDVAGSKLKKSDLLKALADFVAIWWHELRPRSAPIEPRSVSE